MNEKMKYYSDLSDGAKYLINLFYNVEEKYCCTLHKIEQLLIIYTLWCIKHDVPNLIFYYSNLVTSPHLNDNQLRFYTLYLDWPTKIIEGKKIEDKTKIEDEIIENKNIPDLFKIYDFESNNISHQSQNILIKIFRTFGNWKTKDLMIETSNLFNQMQLENTSKKTLVETMKNKLSLMNNSPIVDFINKNVLTESEINNDENIQKEELKYSKPKKINMLTKKR